MGYEIKLYIGKAKGGPSSMDNGHTWLDVYAMIDLCKPGYSSAIHDLSGAGFKHRKQENPHELVYFYAEDGNTSIQVDSYGEKLRGIPIQDVLTALERDSKRDKYHRFVWGVEILKSIQSSAPNAVVAIYGH